MNMAVLIAKIAFLILIVTVMLMRKILGFFPSHMVKSVVHRPFSPFDWIVHL